MTKKIIAWPDSKGIREKISVEFEDVTFVNSFEEFKEKVSVDTLNIMDTFHLEGADKGFFAEEVEEFVASNSNINFHLFYCENSEGMSGLNIGHIIKKNSNAKSYYPLPEISLRLRLEKGI